MGCGKSREGIVSSSLKRKCNQHEHGPRCLGSGQGDDSVPPSGFDAPLYQGLELQPSSVSSATFPYTSRRLLLRRVECSCRLHLCRVLLVRHKARPALVGRIRSKQSRLIPIRLSAFEHLLYPLILPMLPMYCKLHNNTAFSQL